MGGIDGLVSIINRLGRTLDSQDAEIEDLKNQVAQMQKTIDDLTEGKGA